MRTGYLVKSDDVLDHRREPSFSKKDLEQYLSAMGHYRARDGSGEQDPPTAAIRLGDQIWDFLLGGDVGSRFDRMIDGLPDGGPLELIVRFPDEEDDLLSLIPWELLYDNPGPGFLSLHGNVTVVRSPHVKAPGEPPLPSQKLRVVFVGASPVGDSSPIDIEAEVTALRRSLRPEETDNQLEVLDPPSFDELAKRLANPEPIDVLHISAHGSAEGPVIDFEDGTDERGADPRRISHLAPLVGCRADAPLVVLNACEGSAESFVPLTGMADELLRQGVHFVVAKQFEFPVSAGQLFGASFYEALGQGSSIGEAMTKGRIALRASEHGDAEIATPTLHIHDPGASHYQFVVNSPSWLGSLRSLSIPQRLRIIATWFLTFFALAAGFPLLPFFPDDRLGATAIAAGIVTTAGVAIGVVALEMDPPRFSWRFGLGAAMAMVTSLVLLAGVTEPWWQGTDEQRTLVAVGLAESTTDEEARQAERLQNSLVRAINGLQDSEIEARAVPQVLQSLDFAAWQSDQPVDVDIVVGGSIERDPTASSFVVSIDLLAAAALQQGIVPLVIDEDFAGEFRLAGFRDEDEPIDNRLLALAEMTKGIADLANDELRAADERFELAQMAFMSPDTAFEGARSPLLQALRGFVEVVEASQTGDFSGVSRAAEEIRELPNFESSELAVSTLWTLDYLDIIPPAATVGLGPCIVTSAPELPDLAELEELRVRIDGAISDSASPLLHANARATLFRLELWRQFAIAEREGLGAIDLEPVRSILREQLAAIPAGDPNSLRLWRSDALTGLAFLERGDVTGNPFTAIALHQRSSVDTSPFYQQAALAEIGNVLECDFTSLDGSTLFGLEPEIVQAAAACYYDFVSTETPPFPLEQERLDLAASCDDRPAAFHVLCLLDQASSNSLGDTDLIRVIEDAKVAFQAALGIEPPPQCDLA